MSYQQEVFQLISSFTGHNANYVVPKEFMRLLKDSNSALILSQLVYWTGRQADSDGWVYKSYDDWEKEIFLSKKSVMSAVKKLKGLDIIETQVRMIRLGNGMLGNRCVHYKVNQEKLSELILNQLKSLESAERELSKIPEGNLPKSPKGTSFSINTNITNKEYDDVPAPPPPDSTPEQKTEMSSSPLSEDQIIKTLARLFSLVPKQFLKPSVRQTIEKALIIHSEDYAESAIQYTNDHSNGHSWQKYRAYLDKTINHGYADGYQSDAQHVDQGPTIDFKKMPDENLRFMANTGNVQAIEELKRRGLSGSD